MSQSAELLRRARLSRGLSQRSLAIRAGTKQSTISRLESGAEIPTLERLTRLLSVMGLQLEPTLRPLQHDLDEDDLAVASVRTPEERLREAISWNRLASQLDFRRGPG